MTPTVSPASPVSPLSPRSPCAPYSFKNEKNMVHFKGSCTVELTLVTDKNLPVSALQAEKITWQETLLNLHVHVTYRK